MQRAGVVILQADEFNEIEERLQRIEEAQAKILSYILDSEKEYISQSEAAKILNVTPKTLIQYRDRGLINASYQGSTPRYRKDEITNFKKGKRIGETHSCYSDT